MSDIALNYEISLLKISNAELISINIIEEDVLSARTPLSLI
ncbi:MAG TPA: hypothetical protein VF084_03260 [Nitrososphaeraceae archaeon]